MKLFLSKIHKPSFDLVLPRIIMDCGGQVTLAEAFAFVEQCDRALYQHDAIDLASLLMDSSKFWTILVMTAKLIEMEMDKTLYCWFYGQSGHVKKDFLKQKKAPTVKKLKRKIIVSAKD